MTGVVGDLNERDAHPRPGASVTVTAVMASVPLLVRKVNASAMVAAPPGAMVALGGSVPLPASSRSA